MCSTSHHGILKNRKDGKGYSYSMRRLGIEDMDVVLALQSLVTDSMPDLSYCLPSSVPDWSRMLTEEGYVLGVFVDSKLIAYRAILFPAHNLDNLGRHLHFKEDQLSKVFHLELAHVHPDFQGNHLQMTMTHQLIDMLKKDGRWQHLFSTVYPLNYPSIKDKFSVNMVIVELEQMYIGVWRYLFYSNITEILELDTGHSILAAVEDFDTQTKLLNDGYYGYMLISENNRVSGIKFAKAVKKCLLGKGLYYEA